MELLTAVINDDVYALISRLSAIKRCEARDTHSQLKLPVLIV
jgi:hypothetical protein